MELVKGAEFLEQWETGFWEIEGFYFVNWVFCAIQRGLSDILNKCWWFIENLDVLGEWIFEWVGEGAMNFLKFLRGKFFLLNPERVDREDLWVVTEPPNT